MTESERQALREKHRDNGIDGRCETCHYDTPIEGLSDISVCTAPPYPCDVIKVLDFYDKQDDDILEIIHTYDQEPISAIVRIWNLLGNRA